MSTFIKIGNTIINNSRKMNNINLIRSSSVFSETVKPNYFKKSSSMSSFHNISTKYDSTKYNSIHEPKTSSRFKSNTTNFKFFNFNNRYNNINNMNNKPEFSSFTGKDYINEANKILHQRFDNKNHDLVGFKNKFKSSIISNTKEISLNNYIIGEIKKNINNMIIKQENIKKSLVNCENEFELDYKKFLNYLEYRKIKLKKENEDIIKYKEILEQTREKYNKEFFSNKKLNEELEKIIKKICLLKNYGSFVYKILGINFWLSDIPELDQKNSNLNEISELILEKYDFVVNNSELINKQQENFDETFLMIKFKEYEDKFIKTMKSKDSLLEELDTDNTYNENNLNIKLLKYKYNNLKNKETNLILEKNKLIKNIDNIKNKRHKDENVNKFLEYIIQLGKEAEKLNINENNYFENDFPKEYEKMLKEYDYNFYTINTINDLKKKERLINKFIEFIEKVEKSDDKKIITKIELERKNENKREKLKSLKLKMKQKNEDRNKRSIERNTKFVVIGRQVPKLFQFNKSKNLKLKQNDKNKNDMDMLFYNENEE